MRLKSARVQNYRSIYDTGNFDVEENKTLLVGVNEAGKTAVLKAVQTVHAPDGTETLDALRDYPPSGGWRYSPKLGDATSGLTSSPT